MEEFFIQCFIVVLGTCWQEDVAPNVLMDDFAVCTQARESDGHVLVKLDGNLRRTEVPKSDRDKLGREKWEHSWIPNTVVEHFLPLLAKSSGSAGCSGCLAARFWICCYIRALLWWSLFASSSRQQNLLVNTGKSRNGTSDSLSNE